MPAYAADGRSNGVILVANEVTAQVEARHQLEQLNQELEVHVHQRNRSERLLLEAPAAICMFDGPELVFELVNSGYQALFPNWELLGKPVLVALPELVGSPVQAMLWGVYETGCTLVGNEVLMHFARPGDGMIEDRYFNFIYQARYDEAGQIDGLVVFAFEVTKSVQARQQVQELNQKLTAINGELHDSNTHLRRTNADLDTFVYTASHDLKAPITNIEGILAALRDTLPAAVQQDEVVAHLLGTRQYSGPLPDDHLPAHRPLAPATNL